MEKNTSFIGRVIPFINKNTLLTGLLLMIISFIGFYYIYKSITPPAHIRTRYLLKKAASFLDSESALLTKPCEDAWGNEIFTKKSGKKVLIISKGQDCKINTKDDLIYEVENKTA